MKLFFLIEGYFYTSQVLSGGGSSDGRDENWVPDIVGCKTFRQYYLLEVNQNVNV